MSKVAEAGKGHGNFMFVASGDDVFVFDASTRLHDVANAGLRRHIDRVAEREEGVADQDSV